MGSDKVGSVEQGGDHYFTANPASESSLRPFDVLLAGREYRLTTASGVFSSGKLDDGTRVLLKHTPAAPTTGDLLDLGCGWGPIALSLALSSPDARVWAVDVNDRALDLVRRNAATLGLDNVRAVRPEEVPAEVRFATIWSNPPIRVGKQVLHELMLSWLPRLQPDSSAWLVVQKNLGSDSLQRWLGEALPAEFTVLRAEISKGYRVLEVRRLAEGHDPG
ncbi:class I SAM-dependent methyltransferase [Homoserinimonas sp. OAct 916]|uniref:class I SAM-dependent methyltransferase n=1 Tax=Homoserinimonas sp. OAct 916 TaxID=2211450 RepID=UPI000DBE72CB|nr:methyltransferase [Homoserinimonas sp. OAct 916]